MPQALACFRDWPDGSMRWTKEAQAACLFWMTQMSGFGAASSLSSTLTTWKQYLKMRGLDYEKAGHSELIDKLKYWFIKDKYQEEMEEKEKIQNTHLTVQAMIYFEANWEKVPEHLKIFVAAYMWLGNIGKTELC